MNTTVNPDTIRCVWMGKIYLDTLRVDGEIFESGKKTLDACGRSLSINQTGGFCVCRGSFFVHLTSFLFCDMQCHNEPPF